MKLWQWVVLGVAAGILLRPRGAAAGGSSTVLAVARSIPDGGTYEISGSGVPFTVSHKGSTILPQGNTVYCSGFTFATVMEAARRRGLLENKTVDQVKQFQRDWYGAGGESEQLSGPAMRRLGIGGPIAPAQARPGDFVQFWRFSSGHNVVFLSWVKDSSGYPIGIRYRSAQGGQGVGNAEEFFSDSGGKVNRTRTYVSRLA